MQSIHGCIVKSGTQGFQQELGQAVAQTLQPRNMRPINIVWSPVRNGVPPLPPGGAVVNIINEEIHYGDIYNNNQGDALNLIGGAWIDILRAMKLVNVTVINVDASGNVYGDAYYYDSENNITNITATVYGDVILGDNYVIQDHEGKNIIAGHPGGSTGDSSGSHLPVLAKAQAIWQSGSPPYVSVKSCNLAGNVLGDAYNIYLPVCGDMDPSIYTDDIVVWTYVTHGDRVCISPYLWSKIGDIQIRAVNTPIPTGWQECDGTNGTIDLTQTGSYGGDFKGICYHDATPGTLLNLGMVDAVGTNSRVIGDGDGPGTCQVGSQAAIDGSSYAVYDVGGAAHDQSCALHVGWGDVVGVSAFYIQRTS